MKLCEFNFLIVSCATFLPPKCGDDDNDNLAFLQRKSSGYDQVVCCLIIDILYLVWSVLSLQLLCCYFLLTTYFTLKSRVPRENI